MFVFTFVRDKSDFRDITLILIYLSVLSIIDFTSRMDYNLQLRFEAFISKHIF